LKGDLDMTGISPITMSTTPPMQPSGGIEEDPYGGEDFDDEDEMDYTEKIMHYPGDTYGTLLNTERLPGDPKKLSPNEIKSSELSVFRAKMEATKLKSGDIVVLKNVTTLSPYDTDENGETKYHINGDRDSSMTDTEVNKYYKVKDTGSKIDIKG
jgi:hypothetical protein